MNEKINSRMKFFFQVSLTSFFIFAFWGVSNVLAVTKPSGLRAVPSADGKSVKLSWNAVSGADYYALRVDTGNLNPPHTYSIDNLTTTSKTVTGLTPNTDYTWWVHTLDGGVWSGAAVGYFDTDISYSGFKISSSVTGSGSISKSPNTSDYPPGTKVTLTAKPASGYVFSNWGGDCAGISSTTCSLTMDSNKTVSATFIKASVNYTLTVNKSGSGTITSYPSGINCGTDCSNTYTSGTSVTLVAAPEAGSTFTRWSGGTCSGSSPTCSFNMNSNISVTANFGSSTLSAPSNFRAVCNSNGKDINFSWNPVSGADHYAIRVDKNQPSWDSSFWNTRCTNSGYLDPNTNDYCQNLISTTSKTINYGSQRTAPFRAWVHAVDSTGTVWSPHSEIYFSCMSSVPAPTNLRASCSWSSGKTYLNMSWNSVSIADIYGLRVDRNPSSWNTIYWDTNCSSTAKWYNNDFCQNTTTTSKTIEITPNEPYLWWVHAIDDDQGAGLVWSPSAKYFSSISCPPTPPSASVKGSCGTNATNYSYSTTRYPSTTNTAFCSTGTPSPIASSIAFPAQGSSQTWQCTGSNGGTTATCLASRSTAPAPANKLPQAVINTPTTNQTITAGKSVSFSGYGTDSDGTIVAYEWRQSNCSTGTLLSTGSSFSRSFTTPGTYTVYFRVRDDDGAWSTNCPSRTITVSAPANKLPQAVINTPTTNQTITAGKSVSFSGYGTDSDGTIVAYEWRQSNCSTGTLLSTGSSFSRSFTTPGTYTVYFRVRDDDGAWSTNCPSRTITVQSPTYSCTGTRPSHTSIHSGDTTGLTANTPWTYSATNTSPKCQYYCNSGYTWNGSLCYLNAACGSANGGSYCNAPPTEDLCANGSPSTVTSTGGNWTWTCSSVSGTTQDDASCSATVQTTDCGSPGNWQEVNP
jgi:plastocyanin